MTFYEAALQVLESSHKPLTTQEITQGALERGLIVSRGKTPAKTMAARLYGCLGTDPRLVKVEDRGLGHLKPRAVRWTLRENADKVR
jgi:hypothetical protein